MALGVLNNLSAIYAENNLNNTTNSLNTALQQLSSGSKINSGADDAAGLSLVDGLRANATALTQSQTNAQEGVGLLQVADGALSQVTALLNRAVTLATEAANGTLNSMQDTAANQEYQTILSEVSNIGSTTTYNDSAVFGSETNIYTGDSSTTGSSIDALNIRTLSSNNIGDTAGVMSYSNGANNVFIDLSNAGHNAALTDSLGTSSQTTTIAVSYMTQGAGGSAVSASANISVGAGTAYDNTAQGLIDAINDSGLGLTASFGTAAQAGAAAVKSAQAANAALGGATDTGIIVSGIGVGTGTNGAGEIGTLTTAANSDLLSGTITVTGSDGNSHAIALGVLNSTDTLADLTTTINAFNYGVTANYSATNHDIVFTSASSTTAVAGTNLTDQTAAATSDTASLVITPSVVVKNTPGTLATITIGNSTDVLTGGQITILGNNNADVGGGAITLGQAGLTDNLTDLAAYINAQTAATPAIGLSAVVAGNTLTITSTIAAGATVAPTFTTGTLANAPTAMTPAVTVNTALTGQPTASTVPYSGTVGTLTLGGTSTDSLSGTLTVGSQTIVLGTTTGTNKTDTMAHLLATINNNDYGVTAALNTAVTSSGAAIGTVMTFTSNNTAINVSGTGLGDATGLTLLGNIAANTTVSGAQSFTVGATGDILSGTLSGNKDATNNPWSITLGIAGQTDTIANLNAYINSDPTLGITSALSNGNKTITFSVGSGTPTIGTANLADNASTLTETTNAPYANQLGTLTLSGATSAITNVLGTNAKPGSLTIGSNVFTINATNANNTMATLAAYINKANVGITATLDSTGKVMTFTSTEAATAGVKVAVTTGGSIVDTTDDLDGMVTVASDTPSVDQSAYYNVGITAGTGGVTDYSTAVNTGTVAAPIWSYGGTANAGFSADDNGAGGVATISYSDSSGQSLSATALSNQNAAEAALNDLNLAIVDVAAQDGYIGAQINTLNSVSSVLTTQQENVTSAQNAVQATDYAQATSNMSKYEILSQTGIAALAQANTIQQEVTKLLQ
jgi:flagellin